MSTDVTGRVADGDGDDARDLLGAYALDAVDDVERRAVERLVETDPRAAQELAEMRATAALLGTAAAAAPPPELRADVLAAIAAVPQAGARRHATPGAGTASAAVPGGGSTARAHREPDDASPTTTTVTDLAARRPRRSTTWLAIAATAVGAATVPSVLAIRQGQQAERVQAQAQAVADVLADPQAQVVRGTVDGGGTAVGVLAGDRAVFTASGLPDPGAGKEYQLWVIRDGEALPDVVMPDDAGAVQAVTEGYQPGDALAVTVEPASGSRTPTTDPVVVLAPVGA